MAYKLLAVDVDGTLVDRKSHISDEDRMALDRARRLGLVVSLSTGRSPQACANILRQLDLDGFHTFFDGALVREAKTAGEVYSQTISPHLLYEAISFARSTGLSLDLYSATTYFIEGETWSAAAHRDFFRIRPVYADFSNIWQTEKIIKVGIVVTSPGEDEKTRSFHDNFKDVLHFSRVRTPAYPDVDFVNVCAGGVSKGKALEVLATHLGIAMHEVIAIGDGGNDIPLLAAAGLGIAMGNAPDELKAVADHITLDITESGLSAAIRKFVG